MRLASIGKGLLAIGSAAAPFLGPAGSIGLAVAKHALGAHLPQQLASMTMTGNSYQAWETTLAAGGWRFAVGAGVAAYFLNPGIRSAMNGLVVAVGRAIL